MKELSRFIFPSALALLLALAGSGCSQKAREARHMERADRYYAEGDYDQAEIEYINVLRINHGAAKAYGKLGIMSFEQGRMARAYALLLRSVQLDTNNLDYHLEFGMFHLMAGKRDKAREEAAYVLSRRPQDPDAPGLLADSCATLNEIDSARAYLQKLDVPAAQRAPIEVAIGNLDIRELTHTAAEAAFERARADDPKYGPLYGALGNMYWAQKDIKKADEAFSRSIESAPPRSPRRMKYAQFKIANGDIAGGKRILEDAVAKAPDYLPAMIAIAGVETGEKKFDDANEWLTKVLSRDPDNYDALFLSGRLGMMSGDAEKAVAQFEKMIRAYPKAPQILYQLALAYNAAGDTPKAMTTMNTAIAQKPDYAEAILALAQMKIAKGDFGSAIVSLRQLIQQKPKMPEAQLLLADTFRQQGDLDEAAKLYRKLEEGFPNNAQTPMLLGMVLMSQNKRTEARKEFERSLELAPEYLTALEQITDLDLMEGHFPTALQRVQRMMDKNPKAPEPSLLVAKIYLAQNNVPQAVATLQKTIEAHPDFILASFTLAQVYKDSNQTNKALDTLHGLLEKHPDQTGSWMLLGLVEDGIGDYKSAREAYEKVLALDSKNSVALNNLAYLYSEHEQLEKGYDLARRARELLPYDSSTADTLGWILYKKGEYPQASGMLRESVGGQPTEPNVQLHLGMTLYMLGDEDAARDALQKAVKWKGELEGREEANKRLAILAVDVKTAGPEARAMLEKRVADAPGDAVALSRLAAIYKHEGSVAKAIAAYEAALKASPRNTRALVDLAQLYSAQPGQAEKALGLAKEAYKLAPGEPGAARTLGHLALVTGDYKLSLNVLFDAALREPGDPELLYDLGQANYTQGQVAEATAKVRSALQSGTNFSHGPEAKRFLDMVALAGNPAQAVAASGQVEQSLKQEPGNVPALMAMGIIHEQKSDAPAAVHDYEEALGHYPDFTLAKRRLAVLYAQAPGALDRNAYDTAFKAHEAFPDDPEVAKALGIILNRQGDFARSAERLKESAAKKTNDAQLIYYLGMDQYQLKQKAESRKSLQTAMALKLPDSQASEAQRVLTELK